MSSIVWFITGVSNGLGQLLAERAREDGHRVIGTVRNKQKSAMAVSSLEDKGIKVIEMDSTESQESIKEKMSQVLSIYGQLDIIVNNAGYAALGPLERFSEAEVLRQVKTNVLGPLFIVQAALPSMRARKSGMIVNMSSYVGMRGDAANGIYALSKFALEGWSESLAAEMDEFGIKVLLPEYGAFRTNFLSHDALNFPAQGLLSGYEGSFVERTFDGMKVANKKQPGDPAKGIEHLFQIIVQGGNLNGKRVFRVPIGKDSLDVITDKVSRVGADLELARELEEGHSTAFGVDKA
ncbi:NAD(P)-binding protein [Xylariaceae sp. AK1471]|nr:NAD(P)-binding protein [Xylariaceae sp. AK1471]